MKVQRHYFEITRGFVQEFCTHCPVCQLSQPQNTRPQLSLVHKLTQDIARRRATSVIFVNIPRHRIASRRVAENRKKFYSCDVAATNHALFTVISLLTRPFNPLAFKEVITMAQTEDFVEAVRQFTCLWDVSCKSFKDVNAKENAWKAIAQKVTEQ